MDLDATLLFTRRWIWLFGLCAIIGGAVGLGVSLVTPPTYEATSRLLVGQSLTTNRIEFNDILAAKEMAQTYVELAASGPVVVEASKLMTPAMDPTLFSKALRVRAPASSTFVEITATAESPQQAADIANALAKELIVLSTPPVAAPGATPAPSPSVAPSLAPGQTPGPSAAPSASAIPGVIVAVGPGTLTLVDPATPPTTAVAPRTILNSVVAGLIGLAIGVVAAFVLTRPTNTGEERA